MDLRIAPYAPVIIRLLQDVVYEEDKYWKELMAHQNAVNEYFERIGVKLVIDENDGLAYIFQPEAEDEDETKTPRLVKRTPLSYETSMISVLLREMLEEYDVKATDSVKLFCNK